MKLMALLSTLSNDQATPRSGAGCWGGRQAGHGRNEQDMDSVRGVTEKLEGGYSPLGQRTEWGQ